MTSVLNVDSIAAKDGTSPVALTKQSAAKVFLNFDQDAPAVDGSLNITSVTDTGTGIFDPQFINNFANVHYACSGMGCDTFIITLDDGHEETVLTTTGDCQMKAQQGGGGLTDNEQTMVTVHGDLA